MSKNYAELMVEHQQLCLEIRRQRLMIIRQSIVKRAPAGQISHWVEEVERLMPLNRFHGPTIDQLLEAIEENL